MYSIETKNLTKTFTTKKRTTTVLDNVNLKVNSGEIITINGTSGSGKTTLLQIIGGLDRPSSGQVIINGKDDITKLNDNELSAFRNKTFGFVFQSFYLQPFLTLRQNIELPSMFSNTPVEARKSRTEELAEYLSLSDRLDFMPSELSGGQIGRAAILRAIYSKPSIILVDEPTGNLDNKNSKAVLELLKKINSDFNSTIVIVTHDELVNQYTNRIFKLEHGNLV